MPRQAFGTLKDFHRVVENCRVTLKGGTLVPSEEGMERVVAALLDLDQSGKKVMLVGNGGSAAIASHQAVDLWKNGGIRAMAFNDASLLTCIGNDYGYDQVFSRPIAQFADPGDILIAISSSGKSANILNAVEAAHNEGCHVITLSGFQNENALSALGDVNFYLASQSYGIVEVGHLLLVHAMVDEVIQRKTDVSYEHRIEKAIV